MEKIIKIDGKDYKMASSALTQFSYKNITGRSFLNDVKVLSDLTKIENLEDDITAIDNFNDLLLQVTYVMLKEADKDQYASFEDFLKSISHLYDDTQWIYEVIELAVTPISRNLQAKQRFQQIKQANG